MEQLPIEVLHRIFQYISYSDKCALRQVSKWFAYALNHELFDSEVELVIDNHVLHKFQESAIDTILASRRIFYSWTIKHITTFPILYDLFSALGDNLLHLTIEDCILLEADIYQILPCLPKLISLVFISNAAFDSIPVTFTMPSLKRLSFRNIDVLTDHIIPSLMRLFPRLEAVTFHNCHISFSLSTFNYYYDMEQDVLSQLSANILTSRVIFASLYCFAPHLVSIDLSNTRLTESGLRHLCKMTEFPIKEINLSYCTELRRNALFQLSVFQESLTSLNVSHVQGVTDVVMLDICLCLRQLKYLHCSHLMRITSKGVVLINLLKRLVDLNISYCPNVTTNAVVRNLGCAAHPTLKILNLACLGYDNDCNILPVMTNNMPNLTELTVTCLGWQDICYIYRHHTKLLKFDAACKYTKDNMVTGIEKIRPGRLRRLHVLVRAIRAEATEKLHPANEPIDWATHREAILALCTQLVDYKYRPDACISNLRSLEYLDLSGELLSNEIFYSGFRFPSLKVLKLAGTKVSTKGIIILVAKCPAIETLDLSGTNITDIAVDIIALGLKRLHYLTVKGCNRLTDQALVSLCRHAHFLRELDIKGCRGPISKDIVDLLLILPFMKKVHGFPK